jgi:hypothetical protein
MSILLDKSVSSNISEADSDFKFSRYYKNILQKSKKKIDYKFYKYSINLNSYRTQSHIKLENKSKNASSQANSTDKIEENKSNIIQKPKNLKLYQNKEHILFNNLLIRKKQKTFREHSFQIKNYKMFIKGYEQVKTPYIVNNNSSLFKTFLNQTKSNFNNKYEVIYSISDWRQKNEVNNLFDSIKTNQHKNNFSDYLRKKLSKRITTLRLKKIKDDIRKEKEENDNINKISLYNNIFSDFLKDIFHKNNLIKLKTMNEVSKKMNKLKKNKTDIFHDNNLLFKSMPIRGKKLKKEKKTSIAFA